MLINIFEIGCLRLFSHQYLPLANLPLGAASAGPIDLKQLAGAQLPRRV